MSEYQKLFNDEVLKDITNNIEKLFQRQKEENSKLKQKYEELKDEKWKDKQLQTVVERYNELEKAYYRGFPINKKEEKAISEWEDQHWTNAHNAPDLKTRIEKMGAIGGTLHYVFIPTSIGTIGTVVCPFCKERARKEAGEKWNDRDLREQYIKQFDAEFKFQDID